MSKELIERLRYGRDDGARDEAADLIEAQQKRIDELTAENRDACFGLNDYYGQQLAESQAREKVLREVLEDTFYFLERHSNRWDGVNGKHPNDVAESAREALSTPHDDSALQAAIAAEREACAVVCDEIKTKSRSSLFRSGAEICSGEIRTRGEVK